MAASSDGADALVISLNFTPGHFSHLIASYRLLAECGYVPHLYLHPRFNEMDDKNLYRKFNAPAELSRLGRVGPAVFWFPSLKNIVEMLRLRLFYGATIIYVLHEPFDSFANYRRAGFGLLKTYKIALISAVNVLTVRLAHEIILPSSVSFELYRRKYQWVNSHSHLIPLLFDDEAGSADDGVGAKDCVSYIGTVAADHAFDLFVDFVEAAVTQGLLPGIMFAVATRSELPIRERDKLQRLQDSGRVIVQSGRPLSTDEINGYYRRSLAVWNAYHRSNQSGVLPKAFMFGAAVISSARISNEFVDDHVTGVLISDNSSVSEIAAAVTEIRTNQKDFATACRGKFLSTFHYRSKIREFVSVIDRAKPASV